MVRRECGALGVALLTRQSLVQALVQALVQGLQEKSLQGSQHILQETAQGLQDEVKAAYIKARDLDLGGLYSQVCKDRAELADTLDEIKRLHEHDAEHWNLYLESSIASGKLSQYNHMTSPHRWPVDWSNLDLLINYTRRY